MWVAAVFASRRVMSHKLANRQTENDAESWNVMQVMNLVSHSILIFEHAVHANALYIE